MAIDPNIKKKADDIRNKIYGKEVRESLASGLEAMSTDVVENEGRQSVVESRQDSVESQWQVVSDEMTDKDVISAPEIIAARDGEANLKTRLDKEHNEVTTQLAQTERTIGVFVSDFKSDDNTWQEAIQLTINYVENIGGGTVVLPKYQFITFVKKGVKDADVNGNDTYFDHSYCVEIGDNVSIELNKSTIQLADNQNASLFVSKRMTFDTMPIKDIQIYNGTLDLNSRNQTHPEESTVDGITLFNIDGLKLNNINYRNVRYSSYKLLGVKNFVIDNQITENSDGDGYRMGAYPPNAIHDLRCQDGSVGYLYAKDCHINKNGTLQGNPVIASVKDVTFDTIAAKDCGGGFKFQDGCEEVQIGKAIFNGAETKTIYNSSENSGFKIQGDPNTLNPPKNMTIGEIISTDSYRQGLYLENYENIVIGSYVGVGNSSGVQAEDVRIGKGVNANVSQLNSDGSGGVGVVVRENAKNFLGGTIIATNSSLIPITVQSEDSLINSVMGYPENDSTVSLSILGTGVIIDKAIIKNNLFYMNSHSIIQQVLLNKEHSLNGVVTLESSSDTTFVNNLNARRITHGGGHIQPVITIQPINQAARELTPTPIRYYSSTDGGFTIRHPLAQGGEKYIYQIGSYIWSEETIN